MLIVVFEPYKPAYKKEITDGLAHLQKEVGGYIEVMPVPLGKGMVMLGNEEGKLLNLQPNIPLPCDIIVGTVIVVGVKGSSFVSLTENQADQVIAFLNRNYRSLQ